MAPAARIARHDGPTMIEIAAYRPEWTIEYRQIEAALRGVLGNTARRIDHIGSTAVPELCAKDVIDVQITVDELDLSVEATLAAAGYVRHAGINRDHVPPGHEGPGEDWTKFFLTERTGERRAHIHVRPAGRPNQRYALLFRDFLRRNGHVAAAYGELKRRLASSLIDDDSYPDVKDPAVDLIYLAAEQWAAQSHWKPGTA